MGSADLARQHLAHNRRLRRGSRFRIAFGAGSVGIWLTLVAFSYTSATVGDVLGAGVLLVVSYVFAVAALYVSEEFGAFANRRRWRLNTIAAALLFALSVLVGVWEYNNLPVSPPTLNQIGDEVSKRTDSFSQNTGKLVVPASSILMSLNNKFAKRELEIGDSGTILAFFGKSNEPQVKLDETSNLLIEKVNGKLVVSITLHDLDGLQTVELVRNEWKVAPPPGTWDRNFNANTLEVKGPQGWVVLQVRLLPDRIQMQWEWWKTGGVGWRFVKSDDPLHPGALFIPLRKEQLPSAPEIKPLFDYPSAFHAGELAAPDVTTVPGSSPPSPMPP